MAGQHYQLTNSAPYVAPHNVEAVYWDTSFILHYFGGPGQRAAQAIVREIVRRNPNVVFVSSDNASQELAFYLIKSEYTRALKTMPDPKPYSDWDKYYKADKGPLQLAIPKISALMAAIQREPIIMHWPRKDLGNDITYLCEAYSLLPTDSLHLAIAMDAGVQDVCVIDQDWHTIDLVNIFSWLPK